MSRILKKEIIKGQRRSPRTVNLATKVTPSFDEILRQHAYKATISLGEMLEKYQHVYLEKIKKEKADKKRKIDNE